LNEWWGRLSSLGETPGRLESLPIQITTERYSVRGFSLPHESTIMPIKFACPSCNKAITMADNLAGKRARCAGCQTVFVVPASSGATAVQARPAGAASPKPAGVRPAGPAPKKTATKTAFDFGMGGEEESGSQPRRRRVKSRGTLLFVLITLLFLGGAATAVYFTVGPDQLQKYWAQITGAKPAEKPAEQVAQKEPDKNTSTKDSPAKDAPPKDAPAKDAPAKDGPAKDPMPKSPPSATGSLKLEALNDPVLLPGATGKLTLKVERKDCQGIVDIEGKGEQVALKPGRAAPGQTEVELELSVAKDATPGLKKLELSGSLGGVRGKTEITVLVKAPPVEVGNVPPPVPTPTPMPTPMPMPMPAEPSGPRLTLAGHESALFSVAFSPDGMKVVTGSNDQTVRVWNAATGEMIANLDQGDIQKFPIHGVGFSADGKYIVACQNDSQKARGLFWDGGSGKFLPEKFIRLPPGARTYKLLFLPDGKRLLSCNQGGVLVLYDFTADPLPKPIKSLMGHSLGTPVYTVGITADGETAVSGGIDGTIRLWDLTRGEEKKKLSGGHAKEVNCVAITPDGQKVVSGGTDKKVIVWDVDKGMPLFTMEGHTDGVQTVAVSPDGKRAASAGPDKTIRLWDLETGKELFKFQGHKADIRQVVYSPDGSQLASASFDNTAMIWAIPAAARGPVAGPVPPKDPAVKNPLPMPMAGPGGIGINWQLSTALVAGSKGMAVLQVNRGTHKGAVKIESLSDKIKIEPATMPADATTVPITVVVPKDTPAGKHLLKLRLTLGEVLFEAEIGMQTEAAP